VAAPRELFGMRRIPWGMVLVLGLACSSGSGEGGPGGSSGSSGSGGSGGNDCNSTPCFAPALCVQQCGDAPVEHGCCGCPSGWIDASACPADAGSDASDAGCAPDLPDAASVACGAETCGPNRICVNPCCGGAGQLDGEACKPAPPFCVDATEVSCCSGNASCTHSSSCSGQLSGQQLECLCA
jgi:hypothetical protein